MMKLKKKKPSQSVSKTKAKAKRRGKIATKITIATVLVLLVVLFANNGMAMVLVRNALTNSEVTAIQNTAREKAKSLESYIANQKVVAQMYTTNATITNAAVKYLKGAASLDETTRTNIADNLAALYENSGKVYENIFITIGSEGYADCFGNETLHDCAEENFYIQCMENGYYFGNNISPVTGKPVYVIAYAIPDPTDENGEPLGTVNFSLDMASMGADIIQSDEYEVTILDLEGTIIADNLSQDVILTSVSGDDAGAIEGMLQSGSGCNLVDLSAYGKSKMYIAYHVTENFITEVAADVTEIDASANSMVITLTTVAMIVGIIGLVVIAVMVTIVVRPLKKATSDIGTTIKEIKSGHGDLTKKITVRTNDEIGIMVDGVNELMATLGDIIARVQETTSAVTTSSSDVSSQIEKAELEITNVSATMEEMSASSEETSASMTQVMTQVDNVAKLVEEMNGSSIEQAEYARAVAGKVKDMQESSAVAREEANARLAEVAENLRVKIDNAKQVSEIANLTDEILNITSQTNLLSLNASIEAARAGEAGKGFAVVADEIRQLADSSKEAANRIQEVTESVIVAVEDLAGEAENVTDFMIENNEKNHKETENLTNSYNDDIMQLAESMTEFKESSDVIQNSMDVIKEAIDAVTLAAEETAQGITSVAQSTADLNSQLIEVGERTSDNVDKTNSLSNEINTFKI
ncbi:MAG: methyl-accepting chemotaxis protein [Lachnospiraceae bacterium]|nr:methyl-accepting chemotaxis protein [Lachnospiraceae bacterium]